MARVRAIDRETEQFWEARISGYLDPEHHPQQALPRELVMLQWILIASWDLLPVTSRAATDAMVSCNGSMLFRSIDGSE
jgi:hypothetical protein